MESERFMEALAGNSLSALEQISKSDLHSHAGRGGRISFVEEYAHVVIAPPQEPFVGISEMNDWFATHVKCYLPAGAEGYLLRLKAAFLQAAVDHVRVLAMSFAVDEIDVLGGMTRFIEAIEALCVTFAPNTAFYPDLALGYSLKELCSLDELLDYGWFRGIDVCNYSGAYTLDNLADVLERIQGTGLRIKAHIGEFGTPDDIWRYAERLNLDEIQHGVIAVKSLQLMTWLANNKIRLNICPTSNILLGVCKDYASHPIRALFDHGVIVTINTDDLMIFNATTSQEYLHLYRAGMSAKDLNTIRETGLAYPG